MGKVYLIGAGPGAADLITLRGARLLQQADAVLYDALVQPELLALVNPSARLIAAGKRCNKLSTNQMFINKMLVDAARHNKLVVRLKGGDPMIFGRAQEELAALQAAGIEYEVVPGITSAVAAAAELGVSLTQRGLSRNVVFITPRVGDKEAVSDWVQSVLAADTAVLYMAFGLSAEISAALMQRGMPGDTPAAIIGNVSLPNMKKTFTSLAQLPDAAKDVGMPALIVLGEVLRDQLQNNWLASIEQSAAVA
ncbi:MAG: uroporphyrinogen-III C-methyltransferase [Gallionella sp.]|nr:uroporphyrinogen-III C-methyltransferase [Gallionella sp.]MDD4946055.1 uroporphyrinogen-III C-methyltransferase [Gallionella sp.]MDD5612238.1 uroporphyrinogen-III C-methyltransferase [Gallionella sp.]